jgi:vacuolar-type H+-ATPase subunit H
MVSGLENLVSGGNLDASLVPPEDVYIQRFIEKYQNQKNFRKKVHRFMNVSKKSLVGLGLKRIFSSRKYEAMTNEMISQYARQIRNKTLEAYGVLQNVDVVTQTEKTLTEKEREFNYAQQKVNEARAKEAEIISQTEGEKQRVTDEIEHKKREAQEIAASEARGISEKTDVTALVNQKLQDYLRQTNSIVVSADGTETFNDDKMAGRLEGLFLKEVIADVEKESGKTGFLAKVKSDYEGLVSHLGEMTDISEVAGIDLVESIIYARERGFRLPVLMEHFIVEKYSPRMVNGKMCVDYAQVMDVSGSMKDDGKFIAAQKAALANNALMKKMSPHNKGYQAVYNDRVWEVTSAQLMKEVSPGNGTETDKALDWLLEKLIGGGPSIATLLTDGMPNSVECAKRVARQFENHPYIHLRIFLIGNDGGALENIKAIGKAAGKNTRVIPIQNYNIASGMISDFENCIKGMYSIDEL